MKEKKERKKRAQRMEQKKGVRTWTNGKRVDIMDREERREGKRGEEYETSMAILLGLT